MSSPSSPQKPEPPRYEGPAGSPDDVLPPVEPPSAGFILQLFFIPLVIVGIVVLVWLLFSWIAQAGSDPRDLVANLKRLNDSSWQNALSLAEQLKNPEYDHVKDDAQLARDLADVLAAEIKAGGVEEPRLRLRIFLCRAIGEFRVPDGLDALLLAAAQQNDPAEINVRAAALESLAVLAGNLGPEKLRDDPRVIDTVIEASRQQAADQDVHHLAAELRSRAAYCLGVLGGPQALDRLALQLDDPYPNVRYNAATGLARQGDFRAAPALLEMLDPASETGLVDEKSDGEKQVKRGQILLNGVRAAYQILQHPSAHTDPPPPAVADLKAALKKLSVESEWPSVRAAATDALARIVAP